MESNRLTENGWNFEWEGGTIQFPNRVLTPTEYNYRKGIKNALGNECVFPQETYEVVDDKLKKMEEKLAKGPDAFAMNLNELVKEQGGRFTSHMITRSRPEEGRDWYSLSDGFVDTYVQGQIKSDLNVVTIPERSPESDAESMEKDIKQYVDAITEAGKLPRIMLDMAGHEEKFALKAELALSQGIKSMAIMHRSIFSNYDKLSLLMELSEKGTWVHMGGVVRKYGGHVDGKPLPASYPSILAGFGIKTVSLRKYSFVPSEAMDYETLPLFDEGTLGLMNKNAWNEKYPDGEFASDCKFAPFEDLKTHQDIFSFCSERELHQPVYAYESVASRHSLQQSSRYIRKRNFERYAQEHEYLNQAWLSLIERLGNG